ncbi:sugar phosphate isomerase/epimerase [Candidatus Woesearchaeota archaeon]|nr:sugar phosphate isomerase/epimerase [Candidatus Woesearchaeota archaeon]MBW3006229.1 sugar phosphate isomerase/epimerase [Candidatus Woesearchaeota archaeon]
MIICAKPWPVIGMKNNIRILKKLGYKMIRYDPNTTIYKMVREGTCLEIFKRDFEIVKKAGMSIEEFHCYALDFKTFNERFNDVLEMMRLADVNYYVQHITEDMIKHKDEMNNLIKILKDNNIFFCIENEFVWEGFSAVCTSIEKIDEVLKIFPEAMFCLDTGHAYKIGVDPYELYKRYKEKIKVIHLHDFKDGQDHLVPFTGDLLKSKIIEEIKQFKGPIVIELFLPAWELYEEKYGEAMEMLSKNLLK